MRPSTWAVTVALVVVAVPLPAIADAPGPTDYRTEVTTIEPSGTGFEIDIIGGDSFVRLTVDRGTTVEVVGIDVDAKTRYGATGFGPSIYISDPDGNTVELRGVS